jgi:hypothetical protein
MACSHSAAVAAGRGVSGHSADQPGCPALESASATAKAGLAAEQARSVEAPNHLAVRPAPRSGPHPTHSAAAPCILDPGPYPGLIPGPGSRSWIPVLDPGPGSRSLGSGSLDPGPELLALLRGSLASADRCQQRGVGLHVFSHWWQLAVIWQLRSSALVGVSCSSRVSKMQHPKVNRNSRGRLPQFRPRTSHN